jgi:hypothetical protein
MRGSGTPAAVCRRVSRQDGQALRIEWQSLRARAVRRMEVRKPPPLRTSSAGEAAVCAIETRRI